MEIQKEGNYWKAYFFPDVEDKESFLLGSIHMYVMDNSDELRKEFIALMQATVKLVVESVEGVSIDLHSQN